jgi:pheromone shutdown-related protein TraB
MGPPLPVGRTVGAVLGGAVAVVAGAFLGTVLLPAGGFGGTIPGGLVGVLDTLAVIVAASLLVGLPVAALLSRLGGDTDDVEAFDIEQMTDTDVVSAMMEEFRQFSPGGAEALIDERDAFIAHRLVALRESGYRVVAVVGAGHREGIERYLDHPEELPPMESLVGTASGRRFSLFKLVGYAITLGFLAFFVLLALGGAGNALLVELFAAWFVVNAVCAGGLAKLAGARWPSAAVGGSVAWLTSVNPLLAPGWFAGYVELKYQPVSVGDISTLNAILDDEEAPIRDLYRRLKEVPLFRLIFVVALTNVGSMIASLLVFPAVLPWLSADIGGVAAIGDLLLQGARNGAEIVWGAIA